MNNAAVYNPPGTKLTVEVAEEEGRAKIRIADDGIGIPEELKRDLFRPFATGDAARGSGHGSGLGLAITAKIWSFMGEACGWKKDPPSERERRSSVPSLEQPDGTSPRRHTART